MEFDREVLRLTGASPGKPDELARMDREGRADLRETETAFIHEKAIQRDQDRIEVQVLVWEKMGFDEWWRSEASGLQSLAATSPSASRDADSLTIPAITGKARTLAAAELGTATADTWVIHDPSSPSVRTDHTAIWTGTEMIVWEGYNGCYLSTGSRYNPATNTWTATSNTAAPTGRCYHTAIWTGTDMIVWGGQTASGSGSPDEVTSYYHYSTYTIGGSVTGLTAGNSVMLQNNGKDDLSLTSNGAFIFSTALVDGSSYQVTVLTQPSSPPLICTLTNASGTIAGANVTNVSVTCEEDFPWVLFMPAMIGNRHP